MSSETSHTLSQAWKLNNSTSAAASRKARRRKIQSKELFLSDAEIEKLHFPVSVSKHEQKHTSTLTPVWENRAYDLETQQQDASRADEYQRLKGEVLIVDA